MKVGIKQAVLAECLTKGGSAALSDEAQQDTSTLSPLVKSVKITADKDFVIESGTEQMAVKYTIAAKEEDGIQVKEPGCIVVPVKDFLNWVNAQGNESVIKIELQKLPTPEVISTSDDSSQEESKEEKPRLRKTGVVKLSQMKKGKSKTAGKWELPCFDPESFSSVNYGSKAEKQFEMRGQQINEVLSSVGFAAQKKDWEKVLDSISIQVYNKELYFCTTDMMRCALYKVPKDDVIEIHSDKAMLIPAALLEYTSKIVDKDEKVSFSYSEENSKIYISQPHLKIRLLSTEKKMVDKFPKIKLLLEKGYDDLAEVKKSCFNELLINAAVINTSSALFTFDKNDKSIMVRSISEDNRLSPALKKAENVGLSRDAKVIWGVSNLIEGLKVIKSDDIILKINPKSVKVTGKDGSNFIYYSMIVDNRKYLEGVKEKEV